MEAADTFFLYYVPMGCGLAFLALCGSLVWLGWTDGGERPWLPNEHERRLVDAALDARRAGVFPMRFDTDHLSRPSLWRYKRESLRIDQDHETTKLRASADALLDRLIAEQERRRGN